MKSDHVPGRRNRRAAETLGRPLFCGVAAATMLMAGATAASAQSQPAEETAASAATLTEIVVTASKRSERLLTTATPVTAVGAGEIARTQTLRMEDLVAKVPGLNLRSDRAGQSIIILRGITTGSSISSTVSTYIDDTPYGSSTTQALAGWLSPDLDPSDIQRIEVLRGPQGTLYGASSLGGLIKYVTTAPNLTTFGGRVEASASSVKDGGDGHGFRGMVNIPLVSDTLAVRASAYSRRDGGYVDDPARGLENINYTKLSGGRAALLWRPSEKFSLNLSGITQSLKGGGSSDEEVAIVGGEPKPSLGDLQQRRYTDEPLSVRTNLVSASADYDLSWARLVSVSSYSTLHQEGVVDQTTTFGAALTAGFGLPNFGFSIASDLHLEKVTQEIRLESAPSDKLEWRAGFYYTHEQTKRQQPGRAFNTLTSATITLPASIYFADLRSRYTEHAGYADLTYHLTPKFDIAAGIRRSQNKQYFSSISGGLATGPTVVSKQTSSDGSTTFMITPRYKIDENNMVYARVASGYRPGGPNALTPTSVAAGVPTSYGPDTLVNYDVGYKASLLDHKLVLDLSAFLIDWKDVQLLTKFGGFTAAGNGASARSTGFEASITLTPVRGLTLGSNLAYTDAKLTEDAPGVSGKDGDFLPNVPKWSASFSADYDFALTSAVDGFVGASLRYTDDRISGFVSGSPASYVRPMLPSYTTVDLRAGLNYEGYSLLVFAKNVGDTRGINNITSMSLASYGAPFTAAVIQPRTVGVTLSAKW